MVSIQLSSVNSAADLLLRHPIFEWFRSGSIELSMVRIFAEQYYVASRSFPSFLAAGIVKVQDEDAQFELVKNLWDEFGAGNRERFHRELLRKFLLACGVDKPAEIRGSQSTLVYVSEMTALCQFGTSGEALGALGPGCEYITPAEYQIIYDGLHRSGLFSADSLEFFADHISHDAEHSAGLRHVINDLYLLSGDAVEAGALRSLELERMFWDGLWRMMN